MTRRGDREVGGWWVVFGTMAALVCLATGEVAWAHHSYNLWVASATSGFVAYTLMLISLPPRV